MDLDLEMRWEDFIRREARYVSYLPIDVSPYRIEVVPLDEIIHTIARAFRCSDLTWLEIQVVIDTKTDGSKFARLVFMPPIRAIDTLFATPRSPSELLSRIKDDGGAYFWACRYGAWICIQEIDEVYGRHEH